jgi:hypothetical protein
MFGLPISWIVSGVIALGAGGYILHCEHVKNDREKFINTLRSQAEQQKQANEKRAKSDKAAKEKADADAKRNLDQLHRTVARLRNERTRASSVPPAPANASHPELACFSRAEFAGAVGNLEAGVEGLATAGAEAAIGLDSARQWAKSLSLP